MKKQAIKPKNLLQKFMLLSIIGLSTLFIYRTVNTLLNEESQFNSNQVWCQNCQTFHDRETAEQEEQKLVWCVNCNKYHLPGQDE